MHSFALWAIRLLKTGCGITVVCVGWHKRVALAYEKNKDFA